MALLFLKSFPIGTVFIGADDFDPWAQKVGLLTSDSSPGDPTWRQHLDNRRRIVIKINSGAKCTTLEHRHRFKIRTRGNDGYRVTALHESTFDDFKELPDRCYSYFNNSIRRARHDRDCVDRGELSATHRELYDREGEELSYLESTFENQFAIWMARRAKLLSKESHGPAGLTYSEGTS